MTWERDNPGETSGSPWAAPSARVSYRLEYLLLRFCQAMPQSVAAQLLGLASSTLSGLLHRIIERERQGHRIRGLRTIGIDEISYARGHKYATVVYDVDRGCVVWVARGKRRETIDRFSEHVLSEYQRQQSKWACCDMSDAYMGAIQDHCPNAQGEDRSFLKGLRWILLHHSSMRSRKDKETLMALERTNRRIYRAWRLKDASERLRDAKVRWAAERFLKNWTTSAMRSRLEPLKRFVRTVRRNADGILAFVDTRLTNAVSEGLNRIIRLVKSRQWIPDPRGLQRHDLPMRRRPGYPCSHPGPFPNRSVSEPSDPPLKPLVGNQLRSIRPVAKSGHSPITHCSPAPKR